MVATVAMGGTFPVVTKVTVAVVAQEVVTVNGIFSTVEEEEVRVVGGRTRWRWNC